MERSATFSPEELPDGSFIVPHRGPTAAQLNVTAGDQAVVRPSEYIGSFTVKGNDYKERTEFVHRKLESMRIVTRSKPILMVISLSGVKVCSESGDSVFMAHALKRISYATCTPEYCQFSFLAREPNSQLRPSTANSGDNSTCPSVQHCHSFITQTPEQAEELNNIIGDAFKMAYALRRRQKTPTFNEVIERQLQQQQQHQQQQQLQGAQMQQYQLQLRDFGVVPSKEDLSACDCSQAQQPAQQEGTKAYPRHNTTSSNLSNDKSESEKPLPPPPYGANKSGAAKPSESSQTSASQTPQPQRQRQLSQDSGQPQQQQSQQQQQSSWGRQQSQPSQQQQQQPQQPQQSQQQQQQPAGGSKSYGSPVVAFKERMDSSPAVQAAQAAEYQHNTHRRLPYPPDSTLCTSTISSRRPPPSAAPTAAAPVVAVAAAPVA